ncbi:MAG: SDR family NAD(P)-dependent oxidoreductase [Planctomycetaceae bacterium]|nr:SDR family NAD(P)-dependent oxidoreductase [Planctomycetaceae bacterium]
MQLANQTILISGGSSGLGAATARRFLDQGASVIIADLASPDVTMVEGHEGRVFHQPTDVTSEEDVRSLIAEGENRLGPLRGAVICAGIAHAERIVGRNGAASLDAFRKVIEVNLIGTFNVARLAAKAISKHEPMADEERGALVMTASIAAFDGQIGQAAYSASKGGVAALALPLARDLARHGIRVNVIAPGVFETPMFDGISDEFRDSLIQQIPFPHRLGHADEFAALAQHAFENIMLNGTTLRLDGALRMAAK